MATVKIYRYQVTDAKTGERRTARRMGTREYIKKIQGWPIQDTEAEVDASEIDSEGKTPIGFVP
jgi:hypothetical protein